MSLNIAYLDAGIWIAYGLGRNDPFYNSAKELLEERLGRDRFVCIVSLLSILESIDTIRRRITERLEYRFLDSLHKNACRDYIKRNTDEKIRDLVIFLTNNEREMKMIFADFERVDLNKIANETYDFEKEYFGIIRKYDTCSRCGQEFPNFSYRGLGFIDVLHLKLAINYHCNRFITTDQYYNHVIDDPEYSSLEFEIHRPEYVR